MAPPPKPGLACKLWSPTNNKCVSMNSERTGAEICGYCRTLDPCVLMTLIAPDDMEGLSQLDAIRKSREAKEVAACEQDLLICAMENPSFEGEEWRLAFRPKQKNKACLLLQQPGLDEYCLCKACIVNEKGSVWWERWVRDMDFLSTPEFRIKFECIWADDTYKEETWRALLLDKDGKRKNSCSEEIPAKMPGSMCHECFWAFKELDDGAVWESFLDVFWYNGCLRSMYERDPGLLVVV
ncbi:uncharacterized protein K460DRAFT_401662 [Cucurbitaria berberidis CBS 394.84]|uniref:Uncharacterized protein n=1 Tax=Cucurbitaria berberidis CBS 394.84 TaxID=1168544 RepID=A0A9P4LER9_9PLEO|nr:uncharacterized protein K460DRAFT_401662 [Cucurbitaria berberidis CBS 394.84]KAF1851647.1 hypothetical protein K460DRAFT_401662 [Cucurbitaria berberidis CBS 394.84]